MNEILISLAGFFCLSYSSGSCGLIEQNPMARGLYSPLLI